MTINAETITYEQPFNETMRICLRLEQLFLNFKHYLKQNDHESSRHAILSLVKIIDLINRPDLKSKLTQTLTQHASTLAQIQHFPNVDTVQINKFLTDLDTLLSHFHEQKSRFGEKLRNNEFLNQIRLRVSNPGGACVQSIPQLALWLRKSESEKMNDLDLWSSDMEALQKCVDIILYLTRKSNESDLKTASNGFYHQTLNPSLPCDLIRIDVATHYNVFPEFSVGKHRFSIRFMTPNFRDNGHPKQTEENLNFDLTCCRM